ncbi:release factor glutamine methyltransferase [Algimonas ampicilliniresistens]|uniref:Release factor glutamine methyltransferase n=1 Tax=Algimonas ampicilliniresistens TaxID=1298735 RepID=A0ABQ5V422_9PROT|nr:peptide chain release factor N(5)-glutamine methyltransferase [Algimonas ampicilliniresistens]GLQ22263.1 release factor glutamine methyltransferase [Algimonas ampicilliniresistens]
MVAPFDQRPNPNSGLVSGLNYRAAKRVIARQFVAAGLPFADEDALDLLLGLTGLNQTDYIIGGAEPVQTEQMNALRLGAERRLAGDPVDRILGWREFYGRRFLIDDVLSPRGDTEVLLLAALEVIRDVKTPRLLDLGTGSGALAISLLCEREDAMAIATDCDANALRTTRVNAEALKVSDRLETLQSDWLSALPSNPFDVILSNPPYITSNAMTALEREVAEHDPVGALHGGRDGLDPYRIIVPGAREYLRPRGWLGVEIGFDQGEAVQALFKSADYRHIRLLADPAGHDRVVCGWRS